MQQEGWMQNQYFNTANKTLHMQVRELNNKLQAIKLRVEIHPTASNSTIWVQKKSIFIVKMLNLKIQIGINRILVEVRDLL